ncbi:tRNA-dihydrouridine synthase [Salipaludibacillus sp. CF4.18]|uniref:oxidoreductase n=1 Tax=Salipaludibacillus sp. CF4.18 TaxID=3373081 RepID=UPI003EE60053
MTERHVLKSLNISSVDLENRVGLAPMTRTSATEDGLVTNQMANYYTKFTKGGFGLIITEGTYPDEQYSQGYNDQPGIANDKQVEEWKKVIKSVHENGAKIFCQIMHAGALSQGNRYKNETIGPSAVKPKGEQLGFYGGSGEFSIPKEMTSEDIKEVVQSFANSAVRAKQAGFDGIEIHGANGYILDQFLTDYTNKRTDQYGGSIENRVRLLVEVLQAVREQVGAEFPVGIRISQGKVNDYDHKWANGESDAEIIFSSISKAGADFIHVTENDAMNPAFEENGKTLAAFAKKYGDVPIFANGNLHEPEKAEEIIKKGEADLITLGTGALVNPDWVNKVQKDGTINEFNPEKFLHPNAKIKEFEEELY